MKKVLIIGISGFLGSNVARLFFNKNFEIFGMDICDFKRDIPVKFYQCDINSEKLKLLNCNFDFIIHCAGGSTVGDSLKEPKNEFYKTVNTTIEVLEYIRLYNKNAKLIYPSSAAVYGNCYNEAIKEENDTFPVSPYGFYKKNVEQLCLSYYKNFNVKSTLIRFFSIYGEGLKKQLLWDACRKFQIEKTVEFFGTGEEIRDWLYIDDAVNLIYQSTLDESNFAILNGGNGKGIRNKDIIKLICEKINFDGKFYFNNNVREGDPQCYIANIEKALSLGWLPVKKLEQGIENYVEWFKSQN